MKEIYKDSLDFTAWEMTDYVGNVFNRAIIYRGEYFHAAVQYFGHSDDYCRMHKLFSSPRNNLENRGRVRIFIA